MPTKRIAAVYYRVSTGNQVRYGYSLESQEDDTLAYCKANNLHVPENYRFSDDGISGHTIERPQLRQIRELIRNQKITDVVFPNSDRFSRETKHGSELMEELWQNKVVPHFAEDNISLDLDNYNDRFLFMEKINKNNWWSHKIREGSIKGKRKKASKGQLIGTVAPYGFISTGERANIQWKIEPYEAGIVAYIFDRYTNGIKAAEIVESLNAHNIPIAGQGEKYQYLHGASTVKSATDRAKRWQSTMLARILAHDVYYGVQFHFKDKKERYYDSATDSFRTRTTRQAQELWTKALVPPLLSLVDPPVTLESYSAESVTLRQWSSEDDARKEALRIWQIAEQYRELRKSTESAQAKYDYLVRGMIYCDCGYQCHGMTHKGTFSKRKGRAKVYSYYRCLTRSTKDYATCYKSNHIDSDIIDNAIWEFVIQALQNPQALQKRLKESQSDIEKANKEVETRIKTLQRIIEKADGEMGRIVSLYSKGNIEESILDREAEQITLRKNDAVTQVENLNKRIQTIGIPEETLQTWQELSKEIKRRGDYADFVTKQAIVQTLGIRVILGIDTEGKDIITIQFLGRDYSKTLLANDNEPLW